MPKAHKPRSGSMQFWPRKRAKSQVARVRSWNSKGKPKLLGFAGYKVGMTHIIFNDTRKNSLTKGDDVSFPVTIIECPPIKVLSARFYHLSTNNRPVVFSQINSNSPDKELLRKIPTIKKESKKFENIDPKQVSEVRLVVYTQPKLTTIGKKKPELFEIGLGGKVDEQIAYAKEHLGKTVPVEEVIEVGEQVDIAAITTGRGFQGPVKRFGVSIRSHKSEKTIRGPGSLGGWKAQGKGMFKVAHAGQTGYHQRTELNKWVLKIDSKPEDINAKGGFPRYGLVKNSYVLLKGSIPGPSKRIVRLNQAQWPDRKLPKEAPQISYVSTSSPQGR